MNHPTNEQWMSFCYNELSRQERDELSAHLRACPECAALLDSWQQTQRDLSSWRLGRARKRISLTPLVFKWAVAALALFVSFCLGRLSLTTHGVGAALQSEVKNEVRRQVSELARDEATKTARSVVAASEEHTKELLDSFVAKITDQHIKNNRALYLALDKVDSERAADYLSLKKELDALAVNADAELRTTERRLNQVALAQPLNFSTQPRE